MAFCRGTVINQTCIIAPKGATKILQVTNREGNDLQESDKAEDVISKEMGTETRQFPPLHIRHPDEMVTRTTSEPAPTRFLTLPMLFWCQVLFNPSHRARHRCDFMSKLWSGYHQISECDATN